MSQHIVPISTYLKVFTALLVLLAITLGVAFIDLGPLNLPIAMAVAVTKATLILLFFMHVKYSSKLVQTYAFGSFIFLVIMGLLTMADLMSRGWIPAVSAPGAGH